MRGLEKKLHPMAQTDRQKYIHSDGHGNSMTNLAQRGRVGENDETIVVTVVTKE